uniref:Lipoprotein n=1 Tax=Candidatus Kentrum sp. FM TaxID=2126340 RepID=A0A450U082_9GAMM|nr:MAG: hypothetical protein BECKFM1743A_GA0114220_108201 [Candidatus Kentron sp. FM]VFJ75628.1 MAG: hypothetical protein BECKFM1743C_GA0114222_108621 [Candidatus Kentron sp. FM]VFK23491.1 MAG: hypothetical protein BECKFM1743B_GA0114221_109281 [Candidatus Kentron sp. FM]
MIRIIAMLLAVVLLGGCSTLTEPKKRPVIEDEMVTNELLLKGEQEIGTLAVTAQRRLIIANMKTGHFCTEPPPEAVDSITEAIAAAFKADIKQDNNFGAEFAKSFASHVNQLYNRSHTVQMFRDASLQLCVDAINKAGETAGLKQKETDGLKQKKENKPTESCRTFTYEETGKPTKKITTCDQGGEDDTSQFYSSYRRDLMGMVGIFTPLLEKEIDAYYKMEQARAENPPQPSTDVILCNASASIDNASGKKVSANLVDCRSMGQIAAQIQDSSNKSEEKDSQDDKAAKDDKSKKKG